MNYSLPRTRDAEFVALYLRVRGESIGRRDLRDDTFAVRPLAARRALDDVRRLQRVGRYRLGRVWFPLLVFGLIYLGAVPLALVLHRNHLGPYSLVALVTGSLRVAAEAAAFGLLLLVSARLQYRHQQPGDA